MDLGLSGLASGFDWRSLVDQLSEIERAPQKRLRNDQSLLQQRNNAYGAIKTQIGVLKNRIDSLNDPNLFDSRLASVGDTSILTAKASPGTPLGSYTFNITQLATAASLKGTGNIGAALSPTNDVSSVTLDSAGFPVAVTAGTFTVNGRQITVETTDTLKDVFDAVSTATDGAVAGSYDPATDTISFATNDGSNVVLGSATDTSNFLQVAKLYNNGTNSVTSQSSLGGVKRTVSLSSANLSTAISDGGSGEGKFKINGVEISYNASADSLDNVIARINNSDAGVIASYDAANDRLSLTNKTTGDMGIAVEDVTGNFLAATGLSSGSLERGKNLLYTINDGAQMISTSNTISEASSGIPGLSITALKGGTTTVQVGSDTNKIKTAVDEFIKEYNKVQSVIDNHTASSTDAKGVVTAGILADERDASDIASSLRKIVFSQISGLDSAMDHLSDLGIETSGNDNSLTLKNSDKLDAALANNLGGMKKLFSDGTSGLAIQLENFIEKTIGESGSLVNRQSTITKQVAGIDTQVADLEKLVQSNRQRLIDSFVAMETAQANINQQLQFLSQRFGAA